MEIIRDEEDDQNNKLDNWDDTWMWGRPTTNVAQLIGLSLDTELYERQILRIRQEQLEDEFKKLMCEHEDSEDDCERGGNHMNKYQ